jgi:hypothetical protein
VAVASAPPVNCFCILGLPVGGPSASHDKMENKIAVEKTSVKTGEETLYSRAKSPSLVTIGKKGKKIKVDISQYKVHQLAYA